MTLDMRQHLKFDQQKVDTAEAISGEPRSSTEKERRLLDVYHQWQAPDEMGKEENKGKGTCTRNLVVSPKKRSAAKIWRALLRVLAN